MNFSRRQFFKVCAGGLAGTTAAALGFMPSVAMSNVGNTNYSVQKRPVTPVPIAPSDADY